MSYKNSPLLSPLQNHVIQNTVKNRRLFSMRFTREEILPFSSAHSTEILAGEATNNKINIPRKGCSVKFSNITYMMYIRIPCLHNLDGWRTLHGKQTLLYHPFSKVGSLEVQFKFSRWHPLTEEFVKQDQITELSRVVFYTIHLFCGSSFSQFEVSKIELTTSEL